MYHSCCIILVHHHYSFYFEIRTHWITSFHRSNDSCFNHQCQHYHFSIMDYSHLFWFCGCTHIGQIQCVELLVQHTKILCIFVWFASPVWNAAGSLRRQWFNEKGIIHLYFFFTTAILLFIVNRTLDKSETFDSQCWAQISLLEFKSQQG